MSDKDFEMWYEDAGNQNGNLHCLVHVWSPRTAKLIKEAAVTMLAKMKDEGYKGAYAVGSPSPDFCEWLGGKYVDTYIHENVAHEVYQWELK